MNSCHLFVQLTKTEKQQKMDNTKIEKIVALIPVLKYKFMGCYPSNLLPNNIPENSFYIVNTDVSNGSGIHWNLLARKNSHYYYGSLLEETSITMQT